MKRIYPFARVPYLITVGCYALGLIGYGFSLTGVGNAALSMAYVCTFAALILQFITGLIHLGLAIYHYLVYQKLSAANRRQLNLYMAFSMLYVVVALILARMDVVNENYQLLTLLVLPPLLIGAYFCRVVRHLTD